MPNSRDNQYQPVQATPVQTTTDRMLSDINNAVYGTAKAISSVGSDVNQMLEDKNKDLKTLLIYKGASEEAKKSLGVTQDKIAIQKIGDDEKTISLIAQNYEKMKQQERIGLISYASGRTPEELKKMLVENPGIADPQNLLDYRHDIARKLAIEDSAQIFQDILSDPNSIDNPNQTITQHVNSAVAGRNFVDSDQKRAYLETLTSTAVNVNEQLMKQAWEKQRVDLGSSITDQFKINLGNMVNSREINKQDINDMIDEYTLDQRKYFPEKSDKEIRANGFQAIADTLYGTKAIVDPYKAEKIINSLDAQVGATGPAETREFIAHSKKAIQNDINNQEQEVLRNGVNDIQTSESIPELNSKFQRYQSEYNNKKISPFLYNQFIEAKNTQVNNIKTRLYTNFNDQLKDQNTEEKLNNWWDKVNLLNTPDPKDPTHSTGLNPAEYALLDAARLKKIDDNIASYQVINRYNGFDTMSTQQRKDKNISVKIPQPVAFGEKHFPEIDKWANVKIANGIPTTEVYRQTAETFGTLTTNQMTDLEKAGNSTDQNKQYEALNIFRSLPDNYRNSLIADKKISGRFAALSSTASLTGVNPNILIEDTAGASPGVFSEAIKAQENPNANSIKPVNDMILSSYGRFFGRPDKIEGSFKNAIVNYYQYAYAKMYTPGEDPKSLAKTAQEMTQTFIKTNTAVVDFAGESIILSNVNPIYHKDDESVKTLKTLSPIIQDAKNYIADTGKVDVNNISVNMDKTQISKDGKNTIFSLINKQFGTEIGTVEIPNDPKELKKFSDTSILKDSSIGDLQISKYSEYVKNKLDKIKEITKIRVYN